MKGEPAWAGISTIPLILEMVLDLLAFGKKDGVLGDVGREVADAPEVPGDQQQLERGKDVRRVLHHVREQHAEDALVKLIHHVVLGA
jgi:hypothetical protein